MSRPRLPPVSEKTEQAAGVKLLRLIGAQVYVLGTTRRRADAHHGTMQTPGLPDVLAFLPLHPNRGRVLLFWEVKRRGGRLRDAQVAFQTLCAETTDVEHVAGPTITERFPRAHPFDFPNIEIRALLDDNGF